MATPSALDNSNLTMAPPNEKVTVTKKALDDLKVRAGKYEQVQKDLTKEKKKTESLQTKCDDLSNELTKSQEDYKTLKKEYDEMAQDVQSKALFIEDLQKGGACSSKPTKSKVKKADLNQELVNHVNQTAKTVLFRTWKFIEDSLEEEEVTKEIIPYLPVDIGMAEDEFVANYSNVVYEAIKNARTEVQSNGKKRAKELFDKLKELPTTEQILTVLDMSPEDLEKSSNNTFKTIQTWYTDRWLPIVVGSEYWNESNRHFKLPTDTCKITKRDGTEEEKVLCTVSSEGFGLLIYDNCHSKWNNILKLKAENPGANIPRKGNEAKPFEAKWTLTKEGQKKYGGWKEEGMERFGDLQDAIEEIRKKDADNGRAKQEYAKKIVREMYKIPDNVTDPSQNMGKKRSRTPTPPPVDPAKRKVKRRKE